MILLGLKKAFDVTLKCRGSSQSITFYSCSRMDEEVKKLKEMHFNYNNGIKGLEGNEVARLKNILE